MRYEAFLLAAGAGEQIPMDQELMQKSDFRKRFKKLGRWRLVKKLFYELYVYLIDKIKHAYLFVDKHLNVLWRLASLNVIKSLNHVEYALQT